MKWLRLFNEKSAYDNVKATLDKPNVSYVIENNKVYYLTDKTEAEILMFSMTDYKLYGEDMGDGQIQYFTFEYVGTKEYEGRDYYEYSYMGTMSILTPTRNITKVTFPFDDYYVAIEEEGIMPLWYLGLYSLYGFTSVPENKVLIKHRTDIGTNTNGHEYVDLGLTSGTLWSTMNVGADSATSYGGYYQWGDTVDKSNDECTWEDYKYSNNDGTELSKYNTGGVSGMEVGGIIDNKMTLDLEDDVARTTMGGDWKMPSLAQMDELYQETNNEWVENYNDSGVNGILFTSKKDDSKSIFIPAAGNRYENSIQFVGEGYHLRSNSLYLIYPAFAFISYGTGDGYGIDGFERCIGSSVRGIL